MLNLAVAATVTVPPLILWCLSFNLTFLLSLFPFYTLFSQPLSAPLCIWDSDTQADDKLSLHLLTYEQDVPSGASLVFQFDCDWLVYMSRKYCVKDVTHAAITGLQGTFVETRRFPRTNKCPKKRWFNYSSPILKSFPLSAGEPRWAEAEVGHRALQEQTASEGPEEGLRRVLAVGDQQPRLRSPWHQAWSARQRGQGANDSRGEEGLVCRMP